MQNRIKTILERHVFIYDENNDKVYPEGVDKAAEAIVKLVQTQPVDRVRAMAALVFCFGSGPAAKMYSVPGVGALYQVIIFSDGKTECNCRGEEGVPCPHVPAVKLYLERE